MTLSTRTLERLIAKNTWNETRWLPGHSLAQLAVNAEDGLQSLKFWREKSVQWLKTPVSLGSSLEPQGHSYIGWQERIFALGRDAGQILTWEHKDSDQPQILDLARPLSLLATDPRGRWISWITGPTPYRCEVQRLDQKSPPETFTDLEGVPYAWAWHPHESYSLAILCPNELCPWQGARLLLFAYRDGARGPAALSSQALSPPSEGDAPCLEAHFSPSGQQILGLWRTGEWYQIWSYRIASKQWTLLTHDRAERARPHRRCDGQSFAIVRGGDEILSLRQERGFFQLVSQRLGAGTSDILLPREYSYLEHLSVNPETNALSVIAASAHVPPTQIEMRATPSSWQIQGLRGVATDLESMGLHGEALSWPSEDGQTIHGILYRDRRRAGPLPLIMPVHGGPTEQVAATWPVKAQAFVAHGYAVLYVNYRGSWGYGHSYQNALGGHWGEMDVQDIISGIGPLAAAGWIDPQRVALWGGGWGGSTVLRALAHSPKTFRAAVAVYPLCDFNDYAQRANPLQRAELTWALGSSSSAELGRRSPLSYKDQILTPLALFHGERDPLVPADQIRMLAASLEARRIPCWLSIYANEAHTWHQRATLEDYYCKVGSFLARFLRREPEGS